MRNNRYIYTVTILCCTLLTACDKYLDITPKGYTLLTTVDNYDQWLSDEEALGLLPAELNELADNVDHPGIPLAPSAVTDLMYIWAPQFSTVLNTAPVCWGSHYANINKYNTVLQGIDAATGGTDQQRKSLRAEALLGRAFEYFYLLNEYAKPYDSATVATDLGVPFVTSNDVAQKTPPRSTAKDIYDQIISDIDTAIPDLPLDNSANHFRGSVAAAYSVLARIYLYARDYADAAKNAQLALQSARATMLDYNNLPTLSANSNNNGHVGQRPDVIYGRENPGSETPTLDFLHSYDPNDIRFRLFYSTDNYTARGNTTFEPIFTISYLAYTNFGTSVPEMKLIIAETAARSGDLPTALQQLNDIRVDRFPSSAYQPLQSSDQDTVFSWVWRERNFELPYSGLRWFDMRRLDAEGKMPAVNRLDAQGNIIATLPPHSPKYTLQIPLQVLQFNPDMKQNAQ